MASFEEPGHSQGTGVQLGGVTQACPHSGTPAPVSEDTCEGKLAATVGRGAHSVRSTGSSGMRGPNG